MLQVNNVIELAGPIGLLCVLIVGFAEVRRWLSSPQQAQYLQGVVFGFVAMLEMEMPITPFDGVIIDLRNLPVILAGAFLGWRGLAVCMTMAILTRLHIGGVGTSAGVAGVMIAGTIGAVWERMTREHLRLNFRHMFQLGILSGLSFTATVFLPADIAIWFLLNAAPILWVIYLVTIPIIGGLIHRIIHRIEAEQYLRAGASTCPDTGLLRPASFMRETMRLSASEKKGTVAGLLVVWPVYAKWLSAFWGSALNSRVQAALAMGLVGRLTHTDKIGLSRNGHLLVPLTAAEVAQHLASTEPLSRPLSQTELRLSSGQKFRVDAKLRVLPASNEAELYDVLQSIESIALPKAPRRKTQPDTGHNLSHGSDSLFAKFDATFAVSRTDTVRLKD